MEDNKNFLYSVLEYKGKKYFKKELKDPKEEYTKLLDNELHKWNLLKKYKILPNLCFFDNEEQHYIIYEYIKGETLANYKFNDLSEKITILASIAEKLYTVHQLFLVHGDLNPTNIIITPNKEIYIIDFAISKYIGETIEYGTKRYCSIEQLHKEKATTYFDIYALGIIMYEILTNKKAYNNIDTKDLIMEKATNNLSIIEENTDIPIEVEKIFFDIMNKKYENALEIKSDLLSLSL